MFVIKTKNHHHSDIVLAAPDQKFIGEIVLVLEPMFFEQFIHESVPVLELENSLIPVMKRTLLLYEENLSEVFNFCPCVPQSIGGGFRVVQGVVFDVQLTHASCALSCGADMCDGNHGAMEDVICPALTAPDGLKRCFRGFISSAELNIKHVRYQSRRFLEYNADANVITVSVVNEFVNPYYFVCNSSCFS